MTVTLAYASMTVAEILDEIKKCARDVSSRREQTTREIRDKLLPALLELKKRTYRKKPGFHESLAAIGFLPSTVRQWFHRSHAGEEIEAMLEPELVRGGGGRGERGGTKTHLPGRDNPSGEELQLQHADRMAKAILEDKIAYAKRLATAFQISRSEDRAGGGASIGGISLEEILG